MLKLEVGMYVVDSSKHPYVYRITGITKNQFIMEPIGVENDLGRYPAIHSITHSYLREATQLEVLEAMLKQ